jgi:uncharacterized membrane protein YeaQ/YmgE (transglycosylase-associated protein family)
MSLAQVLIAVIGLGASITTFCVLRFPSCRREQFRQFRVCSFVESILGAAVILVLCVLMLLAQGAWQVR